MIPRELVHLPDYVYPADEWRLVEKRFYPPFLAAAETLFATANGYLGMRGTFEEGAPVFQRGTFVNGFYESWPIVYGEVAFGFAKTGQTIVNVTDSKIIRLYVDDEPFYLPTATLLNFERALNMKSGTLDREILWETPSGKQVSIKSRRLVSFEHRHLAAISYEVTMLNAEAPVVISSEVMNEDPDGIEEAIYGDPRRARGFRDRVLVPRVNYVNDRRIVLGHMTENSKMRLACGIEHTFDTECPYAVESKCAEDSGKVVFSIDAKPGVPIHLTKYMTYHTSRRAAPEELCERAERTLDRGVGHGFYDLVTGQQQYMDDFWRRSDIQVTGNPAVQQALRFNLFQIIQATGRAEGAGLPAKGLTGQGYEGHYFWDAEIYVLPFLIYTSPRIARNLLKFRHSYLDKARERARQVNQKGALFPWRTINGDEASAYYAAGTAQYHINGDIIYALKKYVDVTGDEEFLHDVGAELLVETARLWADLGFYSERQGDKFCIHGVTGPDEYNTVVNNNTFTNLMARENLWYAAKTVESLRKQSRERFEALVHRTGLEIGEIAEWKKAADNMYIPFDEKMGVHPQDDSFLDKEPWDLAKTPADKYPLLLHHHPLVIYRHQVIKQADVVLAMFLLGHEFSAEQKKRNFDYYDPMTTGDSSLSVSIQAIVAAELGYREEAVQYAWYGALMDLADVAGNVRDGCHIASMGGTWMALVYGLAGLRDLDGHITFRPRIPHRVEGYRIPLTIRGQMLEVDIRREAVTYSLRDGDGLVIRHEDEEIRLSPENPVAVRPPTTRR
ncbi:MAG: glycoside hydrolase family 65 protein [Candidatus Methylomirabilales bacterium]